MSSRVHKVSDMYGEWRKKINAAQVARRAELDRRIEERARQMEAELKHWLSAEPDATREEQIVIEEEIRSLNREINPDNQAMVDWAEAGEYGDAGDIPQSVPDYSSMSRDDLRKVAASREIKGRGSMNKEELIRALQGAA